MSGCTIQRLSWNLGMLTMTPILGCMYVQQLSGNFIENLLPTTCGRGMASQIKGVISMPGFETQYDFPESMNEKLNVRCILTDARCWTGGFYRRQRNAGILVLKPGIMLFVKALHTSATHLSNVVGCGCFCTC